MSTSEVIASTSAPQISSAASSVQPPAKTASRAKRSCSRRQQVVAPGDRRAQRPLPLRRRPRSAGEQGQPLLEPFEQDRRRERLDAGGRELDRERQAVEAPADLGHLAVRREVGATARRRCTKSSIASALAQRVDGDLPLAVDVQRLAARHEHRQPRAGADRLGEAGGCVEQMLEVVEHEQQALVADRRRRACPSSRAPERRPSRRARDPRARRAAPTRRRRS